MISRYEKSFTTSGRIRVRYGSALVAFVRTQQDADRVIAKHQILRMLLSHVLTFSDRQSPQTLWRTMTLIARNETDVRLTAGEIYRLKVKALGSGIRKAQDRRQLRLCS